MAGSANPATHVVQRGDTLSTIAQKVYGDGTEASWKRIYEANKHVIGHDPNLLNPGQELQIPVVHSGK